MQKIEIDQKVYHINDSDFKELIDEEIKPYEEDKTLVEKWNNLLLKIETKYTPKILLSRVFNKVIK